MDLASVSAKREREAALNSTLGSSSKTPRLFIHDSPMRLLDLIDKRFEKQRSEIQLSMQEIIQETMLKLNKESEERLLKTISIQIMDVKNKILDDLKTEINTLIKQIDNIRDDLNAVNSRVDNLESAYTHVSSLKSQVDEMYSKILQHENSAVSCDIRITGVPYCRDENLSSMFKNLCNTLNLGTMDFKSIFRVTNMKTVPKDVDPPIIVRFFTPYERNFILKTISNFKRQNNSPLTLNHIGMDSNVIFYVNENLTPHNYRIFLSAIRLKKDKKLKSVFTVRGLVHIIKEDNDKPIRIETFEKLNFFQ